MSLILDALRRAERERHAERVPVLADPLPMAPAPRRRAGRVLGVLGLIAVAGLLAWSLWRQPPPSPAPEPAPQAAPAPAVERAVEPEPAIEPETATAVNPIPGTETVTSLDDVTDPVSEDLVEPATPVEAAPVTPPPAVTATPATAEKTPAPQDAPPAEAAAPQPPASTPPASVPPALAQPAPLRSLREMPPAYRADFPDITIEVHVYDAGGGSRVLINGRRYREGERLAEGPLLIQIVRDGVVFEHRGERVLYPLGR